jgi:hypothetical protein
MDFLHLIIIAALRKGLDMYRILFIIFIIHFQSQLSAQVNLNGKISLKGESDSLRAVKNLGLPVDSTSGLNVKSIQQNYISFSDPSVLSGVLQIDLTPPINKYEPGLKITFIPQQTYSSGNIMVNVCNLGLKNILKYANSTLGPNDIVAGYPYEIIYDGTNFHLINSYDNICPEGYTEINESLCIEINSRNSAMFFNAMKICRDEGARLCSWSEWAAGCSNNIGLLGNFGQHWEWVNSSSDHNIGSKIVGNGNCANNWHLNSNLNSARFRCCYDR